MYSVHDEEMKNENQYSHILLYSFILYLHSEKHHFMQNLHNQANYENLSIVSSLESTHNSFEISQSIDDADDDSSNNQYHSSELTYLQTILTILKCAVGGGSFGLPYAFAKGGIVVSILFTIVFGVMCGYTIWMLNECELFFLKIFQKNSEFNKNMLSYPDIGKLAFPNMIINSFGHRINIVQMIIGFGIISTSITVCSAYIDFIASLYPEILQYYINQLHLNLLLAIWAMLPVILPLVLLRDYQKLSFTTGFGDICVLGGLIIVLIYGVYNCNITSNVKSMSNQDIYLKVESFTSFMGRVSFLFAIHIVVLPILQNMKDRRTFPSVIIVSYSIISIGNVLFGAVGFIVFANAMCYDGITAIGPCSNILHNLQQGTVLNVLKLLICFDLLFTVPLVLAAARELLEHSILQFLSPTVDTNSSNIIHSCLPIDSAQHRISFALRISLGLLLLLISSIIPQFGRLVGLIGGVFNALMGFVFPPLLHMEILKLQWRHKHDVDEQRDKDVDAANDDDLISTSEKTLSSQSYHAISLGVRRGGGDPSRVWPWVDSRLMSRITHYGIVTVGVALIVLTICSFFFFEE